MANYFYFDDNGQKQGPYTEPQFKKLAASGIIKPDTPMESDDGHVKLKARQIPGLKFGQQQTSGAIIFDVGFAQFLTPTLITVIWWLTVITTIIGCLCTIGMTFASDMPNEGKGIIAIATIAIAVIGLLYTRIILECVAIFFRMERHQRTIKEIIERNEKASKP
jgi:hypothetical protein